MSSSYILSHWNTPLVQFLLNFINKHTYLNNMGFNKLYCSQILNNMDKRRSIGVSIGKIIKELKELGLLSKWTHRTSKSEYKGNVFKMLDKKLNENYLVIGIKKVIGET